MIAQIIIHPDLSKQQSKALEIVGATGLSMNHPDLLWLEGEKLGIEHSRKVKDFLSLKPYQGDKQAVVILQAENLTPEAQNALLKILEEPPQSALIILGTASEDQLLATIISRCQIINPATTSATPEVFDRESQTESVAQIAQKYWEKIEKLRQSPLEERFKFVEKLEEKEEFLYALTSYFRQQLTQTPQEKSHKDLLNDLIQAERWARQNVNLRAILEYLMLKLK